MIDIHKKYINWWKQKLNLSDYAIIWISFIKGLKVENLSDGPAYIVDNNQSANNQEKGKFFAIVVRKSDPSVQFRAEDESKGKANVKAMRKCLEKFDDCSIQSSGTTN